MVFAAVAAAMLLNSASAQTAVLPETKPGQLVGQWLNLCDAPNLEQLVSWLSSNLSEAALKRVPVEDRAHDDFEDCTNNGGLRLMAVSKSDPSAISLLVMGSKSELWFTRLLDVNDAGQINRARTNSTAPPEETQPKDLSDAAIVRDIRSTVDRLTRTGLFSGIVAVARGNQLIASATGGYARTTTKAPFTGSSQFTLGSMAKIFTAVAIGQLVDQKHLSFGDTVGKFFPDYPNQAVRDNVTVAMLLSHTAGLGDFLDKRSPEMMKNGVQRAAQFMPLYNQDEPKFPPGTNWAYSNAGLALAGAIVEKVSGESYPDYLRKHIFAAVGMTHSDPNNRPHVTPQLVTPYTKSAVNGESTEWHEAERDIGSPAGGAISTADDLMRFAQALRSGTLVSNATFAAMCTPSVHAPPNLKYGYALEIQDVYGRTVVGHGGSFPGVNTHLYLVLGSPYAVVVLANKDFPAAEYAGTKVIALMTEKAKAEKVDREH
jgi:CubicO group peptidase (beta-lactamase class C family)